MALSVGCKGEDDTCNVKINPESWRFAEDRVCLCWVHHTERDTVDTKMTT
jgi:hypothetical protein